MRRLLLLLGLLLAVGAVVFVLLGLGETDPRPPPLLVREAALPVPAAVRPPPPAREPELRPFEYVGYGRLLFDRKAETRMDRGPEPLEEDVFEGGFRYQTEGRPGKDRIPVLYLYEAKCGLLMARILQPASVTFLRVDHASVWKE